MLTVRCRRFCLDAAGSAARRLSLSASSAARRRGDIDGASMATAKASWSVAARRDAAHQLGSYACRPVVTTTAADVMKRPCVVKPKPGEESVIYVNDTDSVKDCANIFWEKRIGALMVKSVADGNLVGIMSERDFVKALATDTTHTSTVRDLMTPVSKMVTVSLTTGVGECMELMRKHGIRHLPVMATNAGEDKNQAINNLRTVAERAETTARKQFTAFEAKLIDAFGEAEGRSMYAVLAAAPDAHARDARPLLQRASTAAAKLRLAEERLSAVVGQAASLQESHPVGIISIRDLLLTMTANQVVPLLDWLNEERRTLIEERVGYSE